MTMVSRISITWGTASNDDRFLPWRKPQVSRSGSTKELKEISYLKNDSIHLIVSIIDETLTAPCDGIQTFHISLYPTR